jgi:hypothetical protein
MAAEGLRGTYALALKDLVLRYAGERTLTQVAFCVQDRGTLVNQYYNNGITADSRWVFGRVDYRSGGIHPGDIASLNYIGLQTVDSVPANPNRDQVIVTPSPTVADNFMPFLNRKPEPNGTVDQAKIDKARRASLAFLNPNKYTPKNSDCASCHMGKQLDPNHRADPSDFKSLTYRLDHTHDVIGPFRMFGYESNSLPIMSTRVVNETVVVLDYLNKVVLR